MGFFSQETHIDTVAFILDGDFTRRLVRDLVGCDPTPTHLESFCRAVITPDEKIKGAAYYDCPPFDETRLLPMSGAPCNFRTRPTYWKAYRFQEALLKNNFFSYRIGKLSFNGWRLRSRAIRELRHAPRPLSDDDFDPILVQKQVDMMIGLDIAKLSSTRFVSRLILVTADADLIPAIQAARGYGMKVTIITGARKLIKKNLIRACDEHRDVARLMNVQP
ncbi:MAG: NYN domain-containing protein [Bacteroidota bacterium]